LCASIQQLIAYAHKGKENPQFLHCIMEYGGSETLHSRKLITKEELRRFAFQLIFALHKAQKKYEFVHGDLHLKNMMLKPHTDKLVRRPFAWWTSLLTGHAGVRRRGIRVGDGGAGAEDYRLWLEQAATRDGRGALQREDHREESLL
jgi:thiamine kinase-like enzyme